MVGAALSERKVAGSIPTIGDFHTVGPCKKAVFACLATDDIPFYLKWGQMELHAQEYLAINWKGTSYGTEQHSTLTSSSHTTHCSPLVTAELVCWLPSTAIVKCVICNIKRKIDSCKSALRKNRSSVRSIVSGWNFLSCKDWCENWSGKVYKKKDQLVMLQNRCWIFIRNLS